MKPFLVTTLFVLVIAPSGLALDSRQQHEMVTAHNKWRAAVGVPDLKWSDRLAALATGWAKHLKEQGGCAPRHNPDNQNNRTGENLFWASPLMKSTGEREPQTITPNSVVAAWASESKDYDYAENVCASGKVCGHYTQIVWRGSREIGCDYAVCPDGAQVWVCSYAPPGNFISQKPY